MTRYCPNIWPIEVCDNGTAHSYVYEVHDVLVPLLYVLCVVESCTEKGGGGVNCPLVYDNETSFEKDIGEFYM